MRPAGIRGESGGANGGAVAAGEVRDQPAVMDAGEAHELGACGCTLEFAGGGAEGAEDLRAGKHRQEKTKV